MNKLAYYISEIDSDFERSALYKCAGLGENIERMAWRAGKMYAGKIEDPVKETVKKTVGKVAEPIVETHQKAKKSIEDIHRQIEETREYVKGEIEGVKQTVKDTGKKVVKVGVPVLAGSALLYGGHRFIAKPMWREFWAARRHKKVLGRITKELVSPTAERIEKALESHAGTIANKSENVEKAIGLHANSIADKIESGIDRMITHTNEIQAKGRKQNQMLAAGGITTGAALALSNVLPNLHDSGYHQNRGKQELKR